MSGAEGGSPTPPIFRPPPPPRQPRDVPHPDHPPIPTPVIGSPTPEVAPVPLPGRIPGARRESFEKLPTLPTDVTGPLPEGSGPTLESEPAWRHEAAEPRPSSGLSGLALGLSITGLIVSLFVGWGFPVALAGMIVAIVALRRPVESRPLAIWALVLGGLALIYSAGWLTWAATRLMSGA